MPPAYLTTGPADAAARFLIAHGAGAGMETSFMETIARLLAERGIATLRVRLHGGAALGRVAQASAQSRAADG